MKAPKMPKVPAGVKKIKLTHVAIGAVIIGGICFFIIKMKSSANTTDEGMPIVAPGDGDPLTPSSDDPTPPILPGGTDFAMTVNPLISDLGWQTWVDMYPSFNIDPLDVESITIVYPTTVNNQTYTYNIFTVPYLTPEMRKPGNYQEIPDGEGGFIVVNPVIENWFARVKIPPGNWSISVVANAFNGGVSNTVEIPVTTLLNKGER